jgi:hypothetical protein
MALSSFSVTTEYSLPTIFSSHSTESVTICLSYYLQYFAFPVFTNLLLVPHTCFPTPLLTDTFFTSKNE